MLVGTFYALFVHHRKYYLNFEDGEVIFTGTIHRLPFGFNEALRKKSTKLREALGGKIVGQISEEMSKG